MADFLKEIGRRVKKKRLEIGWDQEELAKESGQSQPSISTLESGKDVRVSTLIRTAMALGADPGDFLRCLRGKPQASGSSTLLGDIVIRLASANEDELDMVARVLNVPLRDSSDGESSERVAK